MSIEADPMSDPRAFARQVRDAGDAELIAAVSGPARVTILRALFAGMPDVFRADRAGALRAVVHWVVTGPPEGAQDEYAVDIADGRCTVAAGAPAEPRLTLRLDAVSFVKMATGNAGARTLFLRGKLKARGDLGLVRAFPGLFDVPKP